MNQEQIAKLKELAQAAENEVIRSHGWAGSVEMLETLRIDEEYLTAASPAAILELIAMAEKQQIAEDAAKAIIAAIGDMPEAERTTAPASLTDEQIQEIAMDTGASGWIVVFAREIERRAILAAAPAPIQQASPVPLFDRKLADLQQRGYEVIGRILHKDGEYALFDSSCRWLTQPQYWRLMHEQDGSLFATPSALAGSQVQAAGDAVDAARYRFLKTQHESEDPSTFCVFFDTEDQSLVPVGSMPGEMDETIDLAMKGILP